MDAKALQAELGVTRAAAEAIIELCLSSSSTGCARYTSAAVTWRSCSRSGRLRRSKWRHDTTGPGPMPRV
jgi:hypothetical protein